MINVKSIGDFIKNNTRLVISYFVSFLITYFNLIFVISNQNNQSTPFFIWVIMGLLICFYAFQIRKRLINKWWFLIFPIIYICFIVGSYFAKVTLNLNNEEFDWMDFQSLWDINFLITLTVIVTLALIFYLLFNHFTNIFLRLSL